tara:strand:- start:1742 stop:2770 length:1029 start_codon:yes stop_codon:yes gene_type:complete
MNKCVLFGPWVGEFSYELSWWGPECRKIKKEKFSDCYTFHIGYLGREIIYKDFIDEYIHLPKQVEDDIVFPATYGCHIDGRDIIPESALNFFEDVKKEISKKFDIVEQHMPGDIPITRERCIEEFPYGEYIHFKISNNIDDEMKRVANSFKNDRESIVLMARSRVRPLEKGGRHYSEEHYISDVEEVCYLDWNPKSWEKFIEKLVIDMQLNIFIIGIPKYINRGGSLNFEDSMVYKKYKDFIKIINFSGKDSLEKQYALLKNTKCSIYGASGAAVVPFFINSPTFTQQTVEEGFRLAFGWEKELTNNLENVKIFDKYHDGEIYLSPVEEMFQEFKLFYENIT